jgi:hypothetical protein
MCFSFFTDGIVEARNFKDEEYETKRLSQALQVAAKKDIKAHEIIDEVYADVMKFTVGSDKMDDQSMFCMRFHSQVTGPPSVLDDQPLEDKPEESTDEINLNSKAKKILERSKEMIKKRDYSTALGLMESLHILAPHNEQVSRIIKKLQLKVKK